MNLLLRACRMLRAAGLAQPVYVEPELFGELAVEVMRQRDDLLPEVVMDGGIVVAGCPVHRLVELVPAGEG